MIEWEWKKKTVTPADILDAAKTIHQGNHGHLQARLFPSWPRADLYLAWAKGALNQGGDSGWDAASCWAKRAACRRIDSLLVHNLLGHFLGDYYKKKAELLAKLQVPGLNLVRQLVIDPRNDIEHQYVLTTEEQALRAVELAELFLAGTEDESDLFASISLGWRADRREEQGPSRHLIEYGVKHHHSPMLLIDIFIEKPVVIVLYPKDEEAAFCPLGTFKADEALDLNKRLRCMDKSGGYSWSSIDTFRMRVMREQLKLSMP